MEQIIKHTKYIDPMVDVAFKQIFGQEKNKRLIKELLEHVFKLEITELSFVNTEHISDGVDNRNAYFDLQCHSDSIGDFIVEVQVKNQEHFAERALFYSTFPITAQAPRGSWDYSLKPVYFLGLLNFSLPTSSLKEDGWVHRYSLRNDETNGLLTNKVSYIFMEVGPFDKSWDQCASFEEKFLYYMKNLPIFVNKPDTHNEEFFEELLEAAEYAGLTKDMKEFYDHRLKNLRDNENVEAYARKMAIQEGLAEGREKGLAEGRAEGRAQAATDIAAKLRAEGIPEDVIERVTNLSQSK